MCGKLGGLKRMLGLRYGLAVISRRTAPGKEVHDVVNNRHREESPPLTFIPTTLPIDNERSLGRLYRPQLVGQEKRGRHARQQRHNGQHLEDSLPTERHREIRDDLAGHHTTEQITDAIDNAAGSRTTALAAKVE